MNHPSDLTAMMNLRSDFWHAQVLRILEHSPECAGEFQRQARLKFSGDDLRDILNQIKELTGFDDTTADVDNHASDHTIAIDPELARIALALKHANLFRVWAVLLQFARKTNRNSIPRALLAEKLADHGVNVSDRNLRRWLYRGHGLYWQITESTVYFAGQKLLSARLTAYVLEHGKSDLIKTNQPGRNRQMYISLAGSLAQFEAQVYAAWIASRNNPLIARSVLQMLFNRTARILRQWEASAGVTATSNEVQYHPQFNNSVPDHAIMYEADLGNGLTETRFRARTVNTYHAPVIKQHAKRGQGRRILRAVVEVLQSVEPAGNCGQGGSRRASTGGLKPTGRLYFDNITKARQSRKHSGERTRYIRLGAAFTKHPKGLWDFSPDGTQQYTDRTEFSRPHMGFHKAIMYAKDVL
ncbi:MAG: hypothetical protein JNJ78_14660 [Anaerolineae bacterium]|jgi:hypothetical protein|nr:hypothetical protein [Anaerolineae bacterium]